MFILNNIECLKVKFSRKSLTQSEKLRREFYAGANISDSILSQRQHLTYRCL